VKPFEIAGDGHENAGAWYLSQANCLKSADKQITVSKCYLS